MKFLSKLEAKDLKGKKVFLRVDLNVPMQDGKLIDANRILRLIPTIKYLNEHGARIILASHFARPEGKFIESMSLKQVIPYLEEAFAYKIRFCDDYLTSNAKVTVESLNQGEIVLLENLRFHKEEEANDSTFAKGLSELADIYINDAFSCSHRAHASITGITNYLPSYGGLLMEEEINNLNLAVNSQESPVVAIVGGKKVSTKFKILSFLADKVDHLIIAGAMANTFIKAQGHEIGKSYYEEECIEAAREFLDKSHKAKILIPNDFAILNTFDNTVEIVDQGKLNANSQIYDMGPDSVLEITELLANSKVVLWNGPLGMFEDEKFATSTNFVARVIAKLSKQGELKSVIGGGDVVAAVEKAGVAASISYISTAGGAFLEYLENGNLPGTEVL
jgi:phosphoglycerate kinase